MSYCEACGTALPPDGPHRPRKWCSERCRKTKYSVPCVDCGVPLNGSDGRGPNAPTRCNPCASAKSGAEHKMWTRPVIVLAIQEWANEHGEPPAQTDWSPTHARLLGDQERADRWFALSGRYPHMNTVVREFGSWNEGIAAAGFTPRVAHGGGGNERRRRRFKAAA